MYRNILQRNHGETESENTGKIPGGHFRYSSPPEACYVSEQSFSTHQKVIQYMNKIEMRCPSTTPQGAQEMCAQSNSSSPKNFLAQGVRGPSYRLAYSFQILLKFQPAHNRL